MGTTCGCAYMECRTTSKKAGQEGDGLLINIGEKKTLGPDNRKRQRISTTQPSKAPTPLTTIALQHIGPTRHTHLVLGVHVSASLDEGAGHLRIAMFGSNVQGRFLGLHDNRGTREARRRQAGVCRGKSA